MSTMILNLAAALATQALPAPGAVQWVEVGQDSGGRYLIDPTSIVRSGDRVRFVMRALAAQAEADGTNSAVGRFLLDCRARTWGMLAVAFYRGDVLANSNETAEADVALDPIAANSGEAFHRRVCVGDPR